MKKLLIGLLIALAVMVMLVFALNACDSVPTAKALNVSTVLPDGVVRPSECLDVDFRDTTTVDSHLGQLHNYVLSQSTYSIVHGVAPSCNGTSYSIYLQKNTSVYIPFVPSSVGYYHFTVICHGDGINTAILSIKGFALDNLVSFADNVGVSDTSTRYTYSLNVFDLSLNTYSYFQVFHKDSSSAAGVYIDFVKVEYTPSVVQFQSGKFTGFVIPDFTFDPNGGASPYDSWDGIVMPNLLYGADFYEFPLYGQNLGVSTGQEAYWTDIPTSNFSRSFNPDLVDPTNVTILGVSSLTYRYNVPTVFQGKAHTYSLYLYTPHKLAITLTSSAGGSTVYEVYNDGVNGLVSLTIPAEQVGSYIYINVQFLSQSTYTAILYYSKLEVGSFFTGYVPIEHGEANVVNSNVLSNFNFNTIPTNTYDTNTWFFSQNNPLVVTRGDENNNGINIWTSSSSSTTPTKLTYLYDYGGFSDGYDLTFALRGKTDIPFAITVTGDVSGTATQLVYYYFLATGYGDQTDIVVHFQYHDNLKIDLTFFEEGQYRLFYAKLELGDTFTGYCESALAFSQESYEQGYARGYQDGASTYASQTVEFAFDDVESYTRISLGWSHFGFTGGEQLKDSYWSMTSSWYEYRGYIIAYAGFDFVYSDQAMTNVIGVRVYISRNPDFWALVNGSVYDDTLQCLMINVFETYSTLTILDSEFPEDPNEWFPSPTVNLRLFNVTYNRGYETLLREYGEAAGSIAYGEGYAKGSSQGYLQGKADGYALAEKTLSNSGWLAFFSAFVDVPIHVITGLLDFEFFGFNLLSLVKILLLFSLTFMVIRLFTKGKVEQ